MNRLLFSLSRRFSSTCSHVRDTARLLRLLVKPFRPCEFCHMPQVWLRNPETWKPLHHDSSGAAPPAGSSGKTGATAPTTFKPCVGWAERSPAIDFPAQSPIIASATPSAPILCLTPRDELPPCISESIQIPPCLTDTCTPWRQRHSVPA